MSTSDAAIKHCTLTTSNKTGTLNSSAKTKCVIFFYIDDSMDAAVNSVFSNQQNNLFSMRVWRDLIVEQAQQEGDHV